MREREREGEINANGLAQSLWNTNLEGELHQITLLVSHPSIFIFLSWGGGAMIIYLIFWHFEGVACWN